MTAIDATAGLSDVEHDKQLRRVLIASTVGTPIEWYDFLLYGTVGSARKGLAPTPEPSSEAELARGRLETCVGIFGIGPPDLDAKQVGRDAP